MIAIAMIALCVAVFCICMDERAHNARQRDYVCKCNIAHWERAAFLRYEMATYEREA